MSFNVSITGVEGELRAKLVFDSGGREVKPGVVPKILPEAGVANGSSRGSKRAKVRACNLALQAGFLF